MNAKLRYIGEDANVVGFGYLAKGQVIEVDSEIAIPLAKDGGSFALVDDSAKVSEPAAPAKAPEPKGSLDGLKRKKANP